MVKPSPRGPVATGGDGCEAPVLAEGKGAALIVSKSWGRCQIYGACFRRWVSGWKRLMSKRAPGRRFVVNTMRLSPTINGNAATAFRTVAASHDVGTGIAPSHWYTPASMTS